MQATGFEADAPSWMTLEVLHRRPADIDASLSKGDSFVMSANNPESPFCLVLDGGRHRRCCYAGETGD